MSTETLKTLNTATLIGFTEKRGHAWHYRAEDQGAESNHYDGPVPVEDVKRRLFDWQAVSTPVRYSVPALSIETADDMDANGSPIRWVTAPGRQAIVHSGTGALLHLPTDSYQIHQYSDWLLNGVSSILGGTEGLAIGSAGLLQDGAVAWVSVEVPETQSVCGVEYRPNLLATTAHNGTIATTYKRVVTMVVCDNTRAAALNEKGQQWKVKHSSKSLTRLSEARDALAVIHATADDFAAQVREQTSVKVDARQFDRFLENYVPIDPKATGKAVTMGQNKRAEIRNMYLTDDRVTPWTGTAFGVVQAVNTVLHHGGIIRGASRPERNMLRAVSGGVDRLDMDAYRMLTAVL